MEHSSLNEILEKISAAEEWHVLRQLRNQAHEELHGHPLLALPAEWNRKVNQAHDALIARAVVLTERLLEMSGAGTPPAAYSIVLFGSGGRREQTLWSDQDNGLIYENPPVGEEAAAERYFSLLGSELVRMLGTLGYPPCEGNVLASNPVWCRPVDGYWQMIDNWLAEPNWEHIRYLLIWADMRSVYGKSALAETLRGHLLQTLAVRRRLLGDMLQNTLHRKVSLGFLGNLITERYGEDAGGIDIKYGSYIPIVNAVRLLSLKAGLSETGTLERIAALAKAGVIGEAAAKEWTEAFARILKLRSETPFQAADGVYSSRGILPAAMLTKERKRELKYVLKVGVRLHKFVQRHILEEIEKG